MRPRALLSRLTCLKRMTQLMQSSVHQSTRHGNVERPLAPSAPPRPTTIPLPPLPRAHTLLYRSDVSVTPLRISAVICINIPQPRSITPSRTPSETTPTVRSRGAARRAEDTRCRISIRTSSLFSRESSHGEQQRSSSSWPSVDHFCSHSLRFSEHCVKPNISGASESEILGMFPAVLSISVHITATDLDTGLFNNLKGFRDGKNY